MITHTDTDKMSEQELIDTLKGLSFNSFHRTTAKEREALNAVINTLEQELKPGYWIEYKPDHHRCSNCNEDAFAKWDTAKKDNVDILTNYCPNCGKKMNKDGKNDE